MDFVPIRRLTEFSAPHPHSSIWAQSCPRAMGSRSRWRWATMGVHYSDLHTPEIMHQSARQSAHAGARYPSILAAPSMVAGAESRGRRACAVGVDGRARGSAWCRSHMLLRRGRGSDALGVLAVESPCPRRPPPPRSKDGARKGGHRRQVGARWASQTGGANPWA
jgi:hypothetical protein